MSHFILLPHSWLHLTRNLLKFEKHASQWMVKIEMQTYQYSRLGSDDLSSSDSIKYTKSSYPIFPSTLLVNFLETWEEIRNKQKRLVISSTKGYHRQKKQNKESRREAGSIKMEENFSSCGQHVNWSKATATQTWENILSTIR